MSMQRVKPAEYPETWTTAMQELQTFPATQKFADSIQALEEAIGQYNAGYALAASENLVVEMQQSWTACQGTIMQGEFKGHCLRVLRPIGNRINTDARWSYAFDHLAENCPAGTVKPDVKGNTLAVAKIVTALISKLMLIG